MDYYFSTKSGSLRVPNGFRWAIVTSKVSNSGLTGELPKAIISLCLSFIRDLPGERLRLYKAGEPANDRGVSLAAKLVL